MLTCHQVFFLMVTENLEGLVKIFNEYDIPTEYILRTCFEQYT